MRNLTDENYMGHLWVITHKHQGVQGLRARLNRCTTVGHAKNEGKASIPGKDGSSKAKVFPGQVEAGCPGQQGHTATLSRNKIERVQSGPTQWNSVNWIVDTSLKLGDRSPVLRKVKAFRRPGIPTHHKEDCIRKMGTE